MTASACARWRLRFALGELFCAACWATLGLHLSTVDQEAANVFVLFLMMLVVAVSTMLSATMPDGDVCRGGADRRRRHRHLARRAAR